MKFTLDRAVIRVTAVLFILLILAIGENWLALGWRGTVVSLLAGTAVGIVFWQDRDRKQKQTAVQSRQSDHQEILTDTHDEVTRILHHVAQGTAPETGVNVFAALTRHLASVLAVDTILAGEFKGDEKNLLHPLSLWSGGSHVENIPLQLAGTPCAETLEKKICFYPERVAALFPRDEWLAERQIACYMGMALEDADHRPLGLLAILHTQPLPAERVPIAQTLLRIFGARAGAELERQRAAARLEARVEARTQELAEANLKLQEQDVQKSKFVSDVSHELRTPISNLKIYLELMEMVSADEKTQYVQVLQQQVGRIQNLIEDILDLSRLEVERRMMGVSPVNLNKLVGQIVEASRPQAWMQGLDLTLTAVPDLPPVLGNEDRLAQVVTNLVGNAINYTPSGQVEVRTSVRDGRFACLEVADTGVGIDSCDVPHLFTRFYRGVRTQELDKPGTGLGLAIVKEIVDMHGGQIKVNSEPGSGSTFCISLPFAENPSSSAAF